MADNIGSYLWKGSEKRTIDEVRTYWTDNVNTTQFWQGDPREIGSPEFFDNVGRFIRQNYQHRYRLIDKECKKFPNGKVLEIGCGAGWESVAWAKNGMDLHAIDLSTAALKLAEKNFQYNQVQGNLQYGNAEEIPFEDSTFDIVTSLGVLHQTQSTEKAVSEVLRVLRPGGEAVVTLYYKYSWKILLSKLGRVNFEFAHEDAPITRLYDKKDLRKLFSEFSETQIFLDYINATKSPRTGFLAGFFNYGFVPLYNLLPKFIRKNFGHAICVIARK